MPNHVTNRLEINADRETVQKVMNFLKGKTDDDNTPCYIDFNNIIPTPEELLIERNSSGDLGMKYLEAMQRKPFYYSSDDLRIIQWVKGLAEKDRKETLQLGALYLENRKKYGYPTWYEWSIATWGTKWNAYHQDLKSQTYFGLIRHGVACHSLFKNFLRYFRMWNFITPMRTKI